MAKIHFRYGSSPRKEFKHQKKMFGGILGGHVYFQVNDYFYGFEPNDEFALHFFPSSNFNSIFRKETIDDFKTRHADQKVLTLDLKLSDSQESNLVRILERYHAETPYDYAVFGMRCGASSYHILSQIGVFDKVSMFGCMLKVPYPKFLRAKLIELARNRNWVLNLKEGTPERKWEVD